MNTPLILSTNITVYVIIKILIQLKFLTIKRHILKHCIIIFNIQNIFKKCFYKMFVIMHLFIYYFNQ